MHAEAEPIDAILAYDGEAVLAVVVGIEGPAYRPLGAMLAVFDDGRRVGALSSGCIESDIAIHSRASLLADRAVKLRYGRGSPFIDIQLPCGGGLDVLLVPRPDRDVLKDISDKRKMRSPVTLCIDLESASVSASEVGSTGTIGDCFQVRILPELHFLIFGKGPEAETFAALVRSAGYTGLLLTPDQETVAFGELVGFPVRHLTAPGFPDNIQVDRRTSITLFFHDHEWEPPILSSPHARDAFYVGAQGSRRASDFRKRELLLMGVEESFVERIHGPIGLVPSARDPRTLAVSVLAEVLSAARAGIVNC